LGAKAVFAAKPAAHLTRLAKSARQVINKLRVDCDSSRQRRQADVAARCKDRYLEGQWTLVRIAFGRAEPLADLRVTHRLVLTPYCRS
jgi:hypothetical protein